MLLSPDIRTKKRATHSEETWLKRKKGEPHRIILYYLVVLLLLWLAAVVIFNRNPEIERAVEGSPAWARLTEDPGVGEGLWVPKNGAVERRRD